MQSGTVPRPSRNMIVENEEPTNDRSQNDPRTDAFVYESARSMDSDPEETSYSRRGSSRLF